MIYNQDTEISKALQQIHFKSLAVQSTAGWNAFIPASINRFTKGSFADVARMKASSEVQKAKPKDRVPKQTDWFESKTLFFTNLVEEVSLKDVWKIFKQHGIISDVILPKKKDKFGKRFGFVTAKNNLEARRILNKKGSIVFKGVPIKLDWARKKTILNNHPIPEKQVDQTKPFFQASHTTREDRNIDEAPPIVSP